MTKQSKLYHCFTIVIIKCVNPLANKLQTINSAIVPTSAYNHYLSRPIFVNIQVAFMCKCTCVKKVPPSPKLTLILTSLDGPYRQVSYS